jgi:hypothetical protein
MRPPDAPAFDYEMPFDMLITHPVMSEMAVNRSLRT